MKSKCAVHQYHSGITLRDGIGNTIFFVQQLLRDLGFDSEIYVQHHAPELAGQVRLLDTFNPKPQEILLIHHSIALDNLDQLRQLKCRKVLVYHNITPPKLYDRNGKDNRFKVTALGYSQISELGQFVTSSIAVSRYNALHLRRRGLSDVTVIPFHKDFAEVRLAPHRKFPYYDDRPAFRLLYVGRITEHKCQLDLIEAVGKIREIRGVPIRLVLVGHSGDGEDYRVKIDERVRALDLADRVVVTGSIPDDELYGHYRAADAYVSFSDHEGFGVPLLEAMTLDVPVIAYAAAAVPETVGDAGVLVHDKNAATLFRHLERLHDDRGFRSELVRKQRDRVLWYSRDRIETALSDWLRQMGAYGAVARRLRTHGVGTVDFDVAPPLAAPLSATRTHYVIEGPFETSYSLACDNREIAVALANRPGCAAYIEPAEGVEDYRINAEAVTKLRPSVTDLVMPTPLTSERVVTIRQMHPPRPNGMLGDLRLMHLPWEESAIPPALAEMINTHADGVVAASEFCKRIARNSGVSVPIVVIGDGIDHFPPAAGGPGPRSGEPSAAMPYTFLHVSSGLARKGIEELLTAYCLAFTSRDPVLLVIKTFPHDHNVVPNLVRRLCVGEFAPAVQVISEDVDQEAIEFLYRLADAVVLPTRGDGFCYPAAEAMARGVPVIITGYGGQLEFCNRENAALIDFEFELSRSHLNVPNSLWLRPSVPHLIELLKSAYRDGRASGTPTSRRAAAARNAVANLRWANVAERIDTFTNHLATRQVMQRNMRLAWISPYNARDGIGTNSENLIPHFQKAGFDIAIIANHAPPVRYDPPNIVRLWENQGEMDQVRRFIPERQFDAVFIQFHFSFYDLDELAKTLQELHAADVDTYLALHRTKDSETWGISLRQIADTLRQCTRLFVHGVDDVNRLKEMGLVDNVVLIPPGVADLPRVSMSSARGLLGLARFSPVIGTFGFLVPPKGFQALIHGFGLLRREFPAALLLMVTSEFQGADESRDEKERCLTLIRDLGLQDNVRIITDFINDEAEAVFLLGACDALVFPYSYSLEAASGAIRIGLAANRPVGATPLPIFAEFGDMIYRFEGTSAADVADGMRRLIGPDYPRDEICRKQREWLRENSWEAQARRIAAIMKGCFEDRRGIELRPPPSQPLFPGTDGALHGAGSRSMREAIEAELQKYSTEDFLTLAFRRIHGRDPSREEITLIEGSEAAADTPADRWRLIRRIGEVIPGPADSSQFSSETIDASLLLELDGHRFIEAMCQELVLRAPSGAERSRWVTALESGLVSKRQLIEECLDGPEFLALGRAVRIVWGEGRPADALQDAARPGE